MSLLNIVQHKEKRLNERMKNIQASIAEIKKSITEQGISEKAGELNNLKLQLELTEVAHESTRKELQEYEKLIGSKDYKEMLKQQEELEKQAKKKTVSIIEKLHEVEKEAEQVHELTKQYEQIENEVFAGVKIRNTHSCITASQPYSWLWRTVRGIKASLNDTKWIKDKLEV